MSGPEPTPGPGITWLELLRETESLVGDRRHARWICERATSTTPDEFRQLLGSPAKRRAVEHLDAMVIRARAGEPIQYVLGSWGFRRLDLAVDRRVLIPRPETEEVAGLAIELGRRIPAPRTVVDLGTGSGAIGLALADELPLAGTSVWITDVSADALDVAHANLAGLGRAARNVRVAQGSWFDALPDELRAHLVVANPPYVAVGDPALDESVALWEPAGALLAGSDGLDDLRHIVEASVSRLHPHGWLVLEHGHDQASAVRGVFERNGFVEIATRADAGGHDRMTFGRVGSRD